MLGRGGRRRQQYYDWSACPGIFLVVISLHFKSEEVKERSKEEDVIFSNMMSGPEEGAIGSHRER